MHASVFAYWKAHAAAAGNPALMAAAAGQVRPFGPGQWQWHSFKDFGGFVGGRTQVGSRERAAF